MKILNFGSCNLDFVYSLDHIVKAGETESSDGMSVFAGGKGLNQSIAIARAGGKVYHAGCIGNDGELLVDLLRDNRVETSYIRRVEEKNGHAIIQVSKEGENSIVLFSGSNHMISCEHVDSVISDFNEGDIILLQNEINNFDYIVQRAYEKGMRIILNPSPCSGAVINADLSKIYCLILNEIEAGLLSKTDNPEAALDYFASNYPKLCVVLTLGGKGAVYQNAGKRIAQSSFRVEAVDTTAAGDTFTGYFIAGLTAGNTPEDILRKAACAAAISVSRHGAAPSIPTIDEVDAMIDRMTER